LYDAIPDAPAVEYNWECDDPAEEHYGISLTSYCSGDYPMYILATHEITVYRGDVEHIDMAALTEQARTEQWDAKLQRALDVIGIHPTQARPCWLLASYWG
jgi:hypothetical protein